MNYSYELLLLFWTLRKLPLDLENKERLKNTALIMKPVREFFLFLGERQSSLGGFRQLFPITVNESWRATKIFLHGPYAVWKSAKVILDFSE